MIHHLPALSYACSHTYVGRADERGLGRSRKGAQQLQSPVGLLTPGMGLSALQCRLPGLMGLANGVTPDLELVRWRLRQFVVSTRSRP